MWTREQLDILLNFMMMVLMFAVFLASHIEHEAKTKVIQQQRDGLQTERDELNNEAANVRQELNLAVAVLTGTGEAAKRQHIPAPLRRHILKRCANTCQFCARPGTAEKDPDGEAWHIEHVIPVNKGGPTRADNLTLACTSCNLRKGKMAAYAFIQKLVSEGVRPITHRKGKRQ